MSLARVPLIDKPSFDRLMTEDSMNLREFLEAATLKIGSSTVLKLVNEVLSMWINSRGSFDNVTDHELQILTILYEFIETRLITKIDYEKNPIHEMPKLYSDASYKKIDGIYPHYSQSDYIIPYIKKDYINIAKIFDTDQYSTYFTKINTNPATTLSSQTVNDPDMLAVVALLSNKEAVLRHLVKFEKEFVRFAANYTPPYLRYNHFPPVKRHHKLFTSFCKLWAKKHGFSDFIKMEDGLSRGEFAAKLMRRELFDDIAFRGTAHGSIAHFQQWVAIVYEYEERKFLSKSPAELYAWIGSQELKGVGEWFGVFEFGAANDGVFSLNRLLLSAEFANLCPLTASMIQEREKKGSVNSIIK